MIDAEKVLGVVRETRAISLPKWGNIEATSKSDLASDLVTEIDTRIEEYLKEKLAALYPDIAFVGEEAEKARRFGCVIRSTGRCTMCGEQLSAPRCCALSKREKSYFPAYTIL